MTAMAGTSSGTLRNPSRRVLLIGATLVAASSTGCPGGPTFCNACPGPPPAPLEVACTLPEIENPAIVKCCLSVSNPDSQKACTAAEQLLVNRCCPK